VALRKRFCTRGRWARSRLPRALSTASSSQGSGSTVTTLSDTGFGIWVVLNSAGLRDPCKSLPTQVIL